MNIDSEERKRYYMDQKRRLKKKIKEINYMHILWRCFTHYLHRVRSGRNVRLSGKSVWLSLSVNNNFSDQVASY